MIKEIELKKCLKEKYFAKKVYSNMNYEAGLDKAYAPDNGLYADGDAWYVAGTRNMGHVAEWWRIPFYKVQSSEIYLYIYKNMDNYFKIIQILKI